MERLQKVIAKSGKYSRRQAEELIQKGKVLVNGKKVTTLGTKIDPENDSIKVNGKKIETQVSFEYLLVNKPRGVMVTRDDPEGRQTIYDFLPSHYRVLKPVGRLDYDSQGLLLLTNDGALAQKMTHPRFDVLKVYEVKVTPHPGPRQIKRLETGVMLDGRKTKPTKIEVLSQNEKSAWLKMELHEGRNRQIRRMCEIVNLEVKTLKRIQFGVFELKKLPIGKSRHPSPNQVKAMLNKLREN